MKKSFIYLSSIIFVSLFTISSVDATFSFKKKEGPAAPTAAEKEAGVNFDAIIKDTQTEITALSRVKTSIVDLQKKTKPLAENQKTFSRDSDPAQIYAIENPISTFHYVTEAVLSAHKLFLSGLQNLKKMKTKGDSSHKAGVEAILQASELSECVTWLHPQLQANMVIVYKYLKAKKKQPANVGELQKAIHNVKTTFEDKKKTFGSGTNKGETSTEEALADDIGTMEENTQNKTLRIAVTKHNENIRALTECENKLIAYCDAIDEYLEQDNLSALKKVSDECEEAVSGHQTAYEDDEEIPTSRQPQTTRARSQSNRFQISEKKHGKFRDTADIEDTRTRIPSKSSSRRYAADY